MNLAQLAENALERLGERKSLVFNGKEHSNVQLFDYSRRLHTSFNNLGMKRGSNIVLCLMNDPLIYPVFQGIFRTGGTAIPVMFLLAASEVRYILMDSKAEGIVTDTLNADKIREAAQGLDHVKWIVVLGGEDNPDITIQEYALETLSEQEIIDFMKSETSSFKVPSKIHIIDALPKNPVGKILKRELREIALTIH